MIENNFSNGYHWNRLEDKDIGNDEVNWNHHGYITEQILHNIGQVITATPEQLSAAMGKDGMTPDEIRAIVHNNPDYYPINKVNGKEYFDITMFLVLNKEKIENWYKPIPQHAKRCLDTQQAVQSTDTKTTDNES